MAVTDIAKIQVRHGLQENLPQLDVGEFGWCTDTRRLFIGNGVTGDPDYAPEIGNTEILTVLGSGIAVDIASLQANVANLQSNVSTLQSLVNLQTATLVDGTTSATNVTVNGNIAISLNTLSTNIIDYNIIRSANNISRVGSIKVTNLNGTASYQDEYTETATTGVTLSFASFGTNVILQYTTTVTSANAVFNYYLKPFV